MVIGLLALNSSVFFKHIIKLFVFFAFAWTSMVFIIFTIEQKKEQQSLEELALAEAKSHFEKDVLIRSWAASHGGVYVPPSETTPPNPHLANVKDRDVETKDGKKLTLVNPAYLTRQLHELAQQKSGIQGNITSLHLTREANKPDVWEEKALKVFETGKKEVSSLEIMDGKRYLRYMGVLPTEKECLQCHSEFRVGAVRGGISITLPYERYDAVSEKKYYSLIMTYSVVWIFGIIGIVIALGSILYLIRKYDTLGEKAKNLEKHKGFLEDITEEFLKNIVEGAYGVESDGTIVFINQTALQLLGYKKKEVIGKNPHVLFHSHPSHNNCIGEGDCPLEVARKNQVPFSGRDLFFKKNGLPFSVAVRVTPLLHESAPGRAVVLFHDITQEVEYAKNLEILATTDPLTKAKNKRIFQEWLDAHFSRFMNENISSSMLMIDIDYFKKVNDVYGHQVGDDVLVFLAQSIQTHVREGDCFARIGGEEFALLLANADIQKALEVARRVREKIESSVLHVGDKKIAITVSIGVSSFQHDDKTSNGIVLRSDKALYRAKEEGRNNIQQDNQ